MKRKVTSMMALGSMAVAVNAYAQSTVTLYGVIDAGIAYVHNVAASGVNQSTLVKFSSGNLSGGRWGFRGTEDLGGGSSAIFQLENGFNAGTGVLNQGGREFGRKAVVGLVNNNWGTVTLGRQYDPVLDVVQPLTGDSYGETFGTPGDADNYDNSVRISNAVKYVSPNMHGLVVEALYAFGGTAGSTGDGQTYSAGASYSQGPLALAAGYFHANGGRTASNGVRMWTSSADSIFNSVVNQGYGSAKSIQIARAGALYTIGTLSLGASYSNIEYARDGLSNFGKNEKFNSGALFVNYQITPASRAAMGYNYTKSDGSASAKYNQFNLGYAYSLSKRTDLYALAAYQRASGTTLSTAGKIIAADASIGDYGANSGSNTQGLAIVGIRHKF
ncbi:porin [Caballeronia sp. DA-9]|uniref:porin n=1 Tax=Caballeronia sp. DA-9 TaxID=3436237 RepID=UPI003F67C936